MFKNVAYKISKDKKKITVLMIGCLVLMGLILIPFSLAELEPVRSVSIYSKNSSYDSNKPGAWKIEKSGKWISKGTAEITFSVDTKSMMKSVGADIYLVLDTSGSMEGSKLSKVKSDSISLINDLFASGDGNKVGLIRFSNDSQILTDLTTSKTQLTSYINGLSANGETNYYSAFVDVGNLLKNYKKQNNRDCIVLFLTDGLPNINTPNEVVQYNYLKSEYSWLIINGIQYEMGNTILDPIKKVTDNQFVAKEETLNEALEEASIEKINYEKFSITDYIDTRYFKVESKNDITVNRGDVILDEESQKIIWNLTGLRSGVVLESSKPKMTIKAKLKNELIGKGGVYPTNTHEEITSKIEAQEENVNSTLTPILADNYKVKYNENAPSGCSVSGVIDENHSVFDIVDVSDEEPVCEGYKFKGWRIIDNDIEKVGSDRFIMPEKDVEVKAIWGKVELKKSIDGKIFKVQNIYEMMRDNSRGNDQNLDFSSKNIDTTSGIYQHYESRNEDYPVYYYRGEVNNNIKYADMCWKIVRTTETGGAKLIYNGLPAEDGSCNNTGDDATIGISKFNSSKNSPAYVGYKYGKAYGYNYKAMHYWYELVGKSRIYNNSITTTNYYYGDGVTYQEGVGYTLTNAQSYYWSDNYSKLSHYYTCQQVVNGLCDKVYFILSSSEEDGGFSYGPTSYRVNYIEMENGETYESLYSEARKVTFKYGNDVVYNGNTYTLTDPIEVGALAYAYDTNERDKVVNAHHYTCFNNSNECSGSVYYIYFASSSPDYITLSGGTKVEEALKEMTSESTNENKSDILTTIDTWYENNLRDTEYADHIEDTVWCNDRSISDIGGWDKDANDVEYLEFGPRGRNRVSPYRPSLECVNEVDGFSVANPKAKLDYPVGLLTADEATLAGSGYSSYSSKSYLNTGRYQWFLSPEYFYLSAFIFSGYDGLRSSSVDSSNGVRPSVSLEPGAIISGGDGSGNAPFEITYDGV